MLIIPIYDTGGVYSLAVDPANLPEWLKRWMEVK